MSFKQKLEQAAAELLATQQAYEKAREKWDKLCAMLDLTDEDVPETPLEPSVEK